MKSNSQEIEATLIIVSENPRIIADEISDLTFIGDYRLIHHDSQAIHDFYFSMPGNALQARRLALRLREIDGEYWITLKGPTRRTDWGGIERLEIEEPWSQDALNTISKELVRREIKPINRRLDSDHAHPLESMKSLGLKVIQDRENHRRTREIVHSGGRTLRGTDAHCIPPFAVGAQCLRPRARAACPYKGLTPAFPQYPPRTRGPGAETGEENGSILAEMAIDSVVYNFTGQKVRHHEVEIEAKEGDPKLIKTIIDNLVAMYGSVLKRWYYGKASTGIVLERMLKEGILKDLLDMDSNLKPAAYEKIEYYLKRGTI